MNPDTELVSFSPDGEMIVEYPKPTASQEYLWGVFLDGIQQVRDLADGAEVLMFDIGDGTHGLRFPQELVSTRLDDQISIAQRNLEPWFTIPTISTIRLVAGTGVHVFGEGSSARMVAKITKALHPQVDCKPVEHGSARVNGVLVDYAHHGPSTGSRHWLHGNIARFYLRDLMQRSILEGRDVPQIVLRGHFHAPVYEYLEQGPHTGHLFILPSFSMLGEHARQATRSTNTITHGITAIDLEDGKIRGIHRFYKTIDLTTKEEL